MFASGTFETTYSGPILATGENARRAKNDARAMAGFAGQSRAYLPQTGGVGAGSRMSRYRAGLEADRRAAEQYGRGQQSMFENLASDAEGRFQYQNNQADELNKLRALMLDRNRIDQNFDLTLRGDQFDSELVRRQLDAQAYQAAKQRRSSFLSSLMDII
jgi:hypothetical protein